MRKLLKNFLCNAKFLFMPSWWLRNSPTSSIVDSYIKMVIEKDLVVKIDHFRAEVEGGPSIWIKNYPYAFGSIGRSDRLPSRQTAYRLSEYIEKKIIEGV